MKKFILFLTLLITQICASELTLHPQSRLDMFDIGLAKINNDDNYDIYTINHNFAESIFISTENGYELRSKELNLYQNTFSKRLEPTGESPKTYDGLNIFSSKRKQLIIYCQNCSSNIKGYLKIPTPKNEKDSVKLDYLENATQNISYDYSKTEGAFLSIDFELDATGLLVYEVIFPDLEITFNINDSQEAIYLAGNEINPKNTKFSLSAKDNHSFAWARVNDDDYIDVYMASGGLRAKIDKFHANQILPESYYQFDIKKNQFSDRYSEAGFNKKLCRSYKAEWVDIDNDSDLDLYIGCKNSLNQLYVQTDVGSGKFEEKAQDYGLNIRTGDEFKWIDLNNDFADDLLIIVKNKLFVYENPNTYHKISPFKIINRSKALGKKLDSVNSSIRVVDLNNDQLLDIFVSTPDELHYFNVDSTYNVKKRSLNSLGLSNQIRGPLNFVDYNLDGLLDICFFYDGIMIQNDKNRFKRRVNLDKLFVKKNYKFKNLIWFDKDVNGKWDVLEAATYGTPGKFNKEILSYKYHDPIIWDKIKLHDNISKSKNNWLQIDLIGSLYNKDAIGTKVILHSSKNQSQVRFVHGTSDSFHSQGHYRQYFGLNDNSKVNLDIYWPSGQKQSINNIEVNQLLTIKKDVGVSKIELLSNWLITHVSHYIFVFF